MINYKLFLVVFDFYEQFQSGFKSRYNTEHAFLRVLNDLPSAADSGNSDVFTVMTWWKCKSWTKSRLGALEELFTGFIYKTELRARRDNVHRGLRNFEGSGRRVLHERNTQEVM